MAVTIGKLKQYLRIDSDYEDELLQDFLDTATAYLQGAVSNVEEKYQYSEFAMKADRLQIIIAAELYQNRDGRNDPRHDYSYAVRTLISQLQYFAVPEVITGENNGEPDNADLDGRLDGEDNDTLSSYTPE